MSVRVLVIEDNRDLAANIEELFEDIGAEVTLCFEAEQAAQVAADLHFDLAIVDFRLPGGSTGLELVPALKSASPLGEIILVTGNATLHSAIESVGHGVFAYLEKPFDPEDLIALGERALAQVTVLRERSALSKELARSEALHRSVVEAAHSLIVGLDPEFRIQMWNRSAAQALACSTTEALGGSFLDFLAEDSDREAFTALNGRVQSALARSGMARTLTVNLRSRSGEMRIVRWLLTALTLEGSDTVLTLAVGTDRTETLVLERRAAEAEAMAAMGRLTTGLAHEIRNPLNAATLQLELVARGANRLQDQDAGKKLGARVDIVKSELRRLSSLLDEFLGLARPRHLAMRAIRLNSLVESVVALQEPVAQAAGIRLYSKVTPDLADAYGDSSKLKQALVNLIVNAIDAQRESGAGEICVCADAAEEGYLEIRVDDNGPGLPSGHQNDVFTAFMTTKEGGTGLGLPIVKKIMELHGGRVRIGERPGGGTSASLVLKTYDEGRTSQPPPESRPPKPKPNTRLGPG